ncbi:hypothetical protein D8682_01080 (plasmid) [Buttiauxella sp. 3AFRM03]|uniref:hypothetical protein n=1 Tax=Buttiauxella sp. 3AFRM03 TaxID=2479367 RepID=UPI000EF7AB93|nr:hypothetical protein [Buttiauxella sp. 3AFRM03]AYN25664.1 hypothetical protein D8682_00850 [Buttiauxella sp. 3AFRM03]AYN25705.1 hypothetical protein D8682_01080 [Buttiauxella sp. 3AFRM03]
MKIDFFECNYFHQLNSFNIELYTIKNFHNHSESYWQTVEEDVNNSMMAEIKDADTEDHENIVDAYVEDLINAQSTAPRFHRETMLVSLYCQAEYTLLEYCSWFNQDVMGKDSNFDKLSRHAVLDNISRYMQDVMGFDLTSFKDEWEYLKNIKLIRNRLVHSNGKVGKKPMKIESFCEQNVNFRIQNGFIVLWKGAIDDAINVLMKLLHKLENENQLFIGRHQEKFGAFEHTGFNNV